MMQRKDSRTRLQAGRGPKENSANRCDDPPRGNEVGHRLKKYLAINDSVYGLYCLNTRVLNRESLLVSLDGQRGIVDADGFGAGWPKCTAGQTTARR